MMRSVLVGISAMLLAACSGGEAPSATYATIEVQDAFIVQPAGGRDMTSGGFSVYVGRGTHTLVEADTDIADRVELHTMRMESGKMRMRRVESFEVTPEQPLKLERGGNHMMLFGVDDTLAIGDVVEIELRIDDEAGNKQYIAIDAKIIGQAD